MGANVKYRWRLSIRRSSQEPPPNEFLCPVTGSVMSDPVVVSSSQTFDRSSVEFCKSLGLSPVLEDGSSPDFSAVFPNLASPSRGPSSPGATGPPLDYSSVEGIVRAKMAYLEKAKVEEEGLIRESERELLEKVPRSVCEHAASDLTPRRADLFTTSSSEESVVVMTAGNLETPLLLATQPSFRLDPIRHRSP